MGRSALSQADSDKLILQRGVERESSRIALDPEQRIRVDEFFHSYVAPKELSFYDWQDQTTYDFGYTEFSGISRRGTMVHVRHRKTAAGEVVEGPLTIVIVGSFDSDETAVISDTYENVSIDSYGTPVRHLYLEDPTLTDTGSVRIQNQTSSEQLSEEIENYRLNGSSPRLVFERGRLSYERHDGDIEPMRDLTRVHAEVMAVTRLVGSEAIALVQSLPHQESDTGHFEQKVVA